MAGGQRVDGVLPSDRRVGPELASVQQDDRITLSRFQVTGEQAVDQHSVPIGHAVAFAVPANASSWVASRSS